MKARITVLGGDGIGPEVVAEGIRCLQAIERRFGHQFDLDEVKFGGAAIDAYGDPLPADTLKSCLASDAVLLGAIGGPLVTGWVMGLMGPGGYFFVIALLFLALAAYAAWRMTQRAAPVGSGGFATLSPTASALAVGAVLEEEGRKADGRSA